MKISYFVVLGLLASIAFAAECDGKDCLAECDGKNCLAECDGNDCLAECDGNDCLAQTEEEFLFGLFGGATKPPPKMTAVDFKKFWASFSAVFKKFHVSMPKG